jgi:hypothetical protein
MKETVKEIEQDQNSTVLRKGGGVLSFILFYISYATEHGDRRCMFAN